MTTRHAFILWLVVCVVLAVCAVAPPGETVRVLDGKGKVAPRGWNEAKPDPWSEAWGSGAYEFRTLWYEVVY